MASSGNTWQKKLIAKGKKYGLAQAKGTCQRHSLATVQDEAKPIVKIKPCDRDINHNISSHLKRGRSGCRLNAATRAVIAERKSARAAFLRGV